MPFHQIPLDQWPEGLACDAAFVACLPAQVHNDTDIVFADDVDGLGRFSGAVVRLNSGTTFAVQHHPDAPVTGMKIVTSRLDAAVLHRVLTFLGLGIKDVLWTAEPIAAQARAISLRRRNRRPVFQLMRRKLDQGHRRKRRSSDRSGLRRLST